MIKQIDYKNENKFCWKVLKKERISFFNIEVNEFIGYS